MSVNFKSYASLVIFFTNSVFSSFNFEHKTLYTIPVLAVFHFYHHEKASNLTECENSDCPIRFLFEDFGLCSRYNNVNYFDWHVYKPSFGSSFAVSRLACSEISLSINEKKLKRSPGKART